MALHSRPFVREYARDNTIPLPASPLKGGGVERVALRWMIGETWGRARALVANAVPHQSLCVVQNPSRIPLRFIRATQLGFLRLKPSPSRGGLGGDGVAC